jgi:hypothetical protein
VVKSTWFREALSQWRRAQQDISYHIQDIDDAQCRACGQRPHSVHVNGNMKLGTNELKRQPGNWLPIISGDREYANTPAVLQHLQWLDLALGKVRGINRGSKGRAA